jgi:hypothetical protein
MAESQGITCQHLVTVGGDLFVFGNENDQTLFAITGHDTEDHNLRWHFREGADSDIFIDFGHWQVSEVSNVVVVDQGIGNE